MPRKRSPSKPRSKSVSSTSRKRPASKGRKPASQKSTPSRKVSPTNRRASPSKSPGRKTAKSPAAAPKKAPVTKTPSTTPAKSPASTSRSASRGRKPTTTPIQSKTTTIATKVEKKPSYTPSASSGLRPRRGVFSSDAESSRRLGASDSLRSRATSAARGKKGTGIVQQIVALPKRAWNAVRVPNAVRRLKRHVKNNWKKYLLFFVAFVAISVAYHFSRELYRSVEQVRTQVADFLEEQKKVFGDAIERASRKVEEWTESSNESQSKPGTPTHEHHHQHVHAQSSPPPKPPRQQPVTPLPGDALSLDDAI